MHLLYNFKLIISLKIIKKNLRTLRCPEMHSAYVNMVENALKTWNNHDKSTYRKI